MIRNFNLLAPSTSKIVVLFLFLYIYVQFQQYLLFFKILPDDAKIIDEYICFRKWQEYHVIPLLIFAI